MDQGEARLFTRTGIDWTDRFPALAPALARLPVRQAWLDGEVTALQPDGRTSFRDVAAALQRGVDDAALVYFVFDLLYVDGYDLTEAALSDRKAALEALLSGAPGDATSGRIRYLEHLRGQGREFSGAACELGLEGVVSKRAGAPYRSGRGRSWLKVKCMKRQEFVVGGFTDRAETGGGVGALVLGVHEHPGGPLRYAGRVGTGWDQKTMDDLRRRLDAAAAGGAPVRRRRAAWRRRSRRALGAPRAGRRSRVPLLGRRRASSSPVVRGCARGQAGG